MRKLLTNRQEAGNPLHLKTKSGQSKMPPQFAIDAGPFQCSRFGKNKGKGGQLQPVGGVPAAPVAAGGGGAAVLTPQQQALQIVQNFAANPNTPQVFSIIKKEDVVAGLIQRINNPRSIDQADLNACGPAIAALMLAQYDPVQFANFIIDMYTTGTAKLGSQEIDPWDGLHKRAPGDSKCGGKASNVVDFLILASLRSDLSPPWDQFEDSNSTLSGITLPSTIKSWLDSAGCVGNIENDTSLFPQGFDHFQNTAVPRHNAGERVVMLINSTMLYVGVGYANSKSQGKKWRKKNLGINSKITGTYPNHYIVYEGNMVINGDDMEFNVWSGGNIYRLAMKTYEFGKMYHGCLYIQP